MAGEPIAVNEKTKQMIQQMIMQQQTAIQGVKVALDVPDGYVYDVVKGSFVVQASEQGEPVPPVVEPPK